MKAECVTMKGCFNDSDFVEFFTLRLGQSAAPFTIHGMYIPKSWVGKKLQFLTDNNKPAAYDLLEIVGVDKQGWFIFYQIAYYSNLDSLSIRFK